MSKPTNKTINKALVKALKSLNIKHTVDKRGRLLSYEADPNLSMQKTLELGMKLHKTYMKNLLKAT